MVQRTRVRGRSRPSPASTIPARAKGPLAALAVPLSFPGEGAAGAGLRSLGRKGGRELASVTGPPLVVPSTCGLASRGATFSPQGREIKTDPAALAEARRAALAFC